MEDEPNYTILPPQGGTKNIEIEQKMRQIDQLRSTKPREASPQSTEENISTLPPPVSNPNRAFLSPFQIIQEGTNKREVADIENPNIDQTNPSVEWSEQTDDHNRGIMEK
ncbi:hypothetical protein JTB14_025326 [Gonioctena quinquepunctata]|nr:hypothetical protein JTB14_025326 [Gonioctena quinquepunctata]